MFYSAEQADHWNILAEAEPKLLKSAAPKGIENCTPRSINLFRAFFEDHAHIQTRAH